MKTMSTGEKDSGNIRFNRHVARASRGHIAIYRPSNGRWIIQGGGPSISWGQDGDTPVPLPEAIHQTL